MIMKGFTPEVGAKGFAIMKGPRRTRRSYAGPLLSSAAAVGRILASLKTGTTTLTFTLEVAMA